MTTVHTPGSGLVTKPTGDGTASVKDESHVKQLQREVSWMMDELRYRLVMNHMADGWKKGKSWEEGAALRAAVGDGLFPESGVRDDVVHMVAGDFNTHLYAQARFDFLGMRKGHAWCMQ